jgi:glycosyltransferase involved in cell wall biosynthesis
MSKVTCIITTTGRPTLNRAIESVRSQTYKDYDLIVIEDKERRGGAWALNKGIDMTTGKYIAILDDDDSWNDDTKLEKQVKFLDDNLEYIACGCGPQKGQGKEIKVNLIGTPFAHVSMMFRRGLRYNEELKRAKDLDFMIRLAQKGKLGIVEGITVHFGDSTLEKKIDDCHWHRKVCLLHKEFKNWYLIYLRLWIREIKLKYYKLTNGLRNYTGNTAK